MFNVKKFLTALMCGVFVTNTLGLSAFSASAATGDSRTFVYDDYEITYNVTNSWADTEVVSLSITNTSDDIIEDWMLFFNPNGDVQYIYDAAQIIDSDSGVMYFKNAGYNANIEPDSTVTFSYAVENCSSIPNDYFFIQSRRDVTTGYSVDLNVIQTWDSSFNGEITIYNTTNTPIEAWELNINTNFTITEITNSWAATVEVLEPYNYKLKGTYTSYIPANSSVTLGFIGTMAGTPIISDYSMTAIYPDYSPFTIALSCPTTRMSTNESNNMVYFYAETDLDVTEIQLVNAANDQVVATMYDDGKYTLHGDDLPYDGVYSCKVAVDNSEKTYLSYYAKYADSNSVSNTVGIKIYVPLTSSDFSEMNEVDSALSDLYSQTNYNSMSTEDKMAAVYTLLASLATYGTESYPYSLLYSDSITFNGNNLYTFTYKCGVLGAARIEEFGTNENGSERSADDLNSLIDNSIVSSQQLEELTNEISIDTVNLGSIDIMYAFDDTTSWRYPYYTQMESRWTEDGLDVTLDTDVTVDDFRHLDDYNIVVFSMHGDYYSVNTPVLVTYENITPEKDSAYAEDLACGDITKAYSHYAIFPSFFTDNYSSESLNDTIIFSESCCFYGEGNDVCYAMAEALIDSGAKTVIGFHNSVLAVYSRQIMEKVVDELIASNTAGQALDTAKSIYGVADGTGSDAAYPIIDGNTSATLKSIGIQNGSFEDSTIPVLWKYDGDARVMRRLGAFRPTSGSRMGCISTGIGSQEVDYMNATEGSVIEQTFKVPSNATTLSFKYNIISEEPLEFLGTQYDDTFKAILFNGNGSVSTELAYVSIRNSTVSEWTEVSNLDFEGGDETTYTMGWKTVSVDVSEYAGSYVTLKFCVYDAGDSIYDTVALIDEVNVA